MSTYNDIRVKFQTVLNEAATPKQIGGITNPNIMSVVDKKQVSAIESFLNGVPAGDPMAKTLELINGFDKKQAEVFVDKCGSYSSVKAVSSSYSTEINDPVGFKIYLLKPDGAGRGEIWLAWLIKDAKVSGGGESFDLLVGKNKKYEIKEYNIKNGKLASNKSPFRLGNAGALSNFTFGDRMSHTVDIAVEISKLDLKALPEDLKDLHGSAKKLVSIKSNYGVSADFKRGEISQAKFEAACEFINIAHTYVNSGTQTDYTIVTFTSISKGNPNLSYVLPAGITKQNIENLDFEIGQPIDLNSLNSIESIKRMLIKVSYIREGLTALISDINMGLDKVSNKYKGITWIVFRKTGMNVSTGIIKVPTASSNEEALTVLKSAYGDIFNVSSASVRVKENM